MNKVGTAIVAAASTPVLAAFGVVALVVLGSGEEEVACGNLQEVSISGPIGVDEVAAGGVTYRGEQLANALQVIRAGADAGVGAHGQAVGLMTAIGESTLINVDYGDRVGPDSRGLFQQRNNGAWGSYEDRMNPYTAATNFFRALKEVDGWETLQPTIAAHRTQGNADPYHYERFWDDALGLLQTLGGVDIGDLDLGATCDPEGVQVPVGAGGWTRPVAGPVTSGFGPRWGTQHNGLDFGAPVDTPIVAAADGTVVAVCLTNSSPCTGYGTLITIDHGGGILTRYAHACRDDVLVRVGQPIEAGKQIARVDSCGQSTGPHLHWEVMANGSFVDPAPFLTSKGVIL